jgi:hypothetical protein
MSLAIYAAPFENNNKNYKLIDDDENIIEKKKTAKNRTQKKRKNLDEKINDDVLNTIQQIHNSIDNNEDEENNSLSNFTPPPPAMSAGSERVDMRNEMQEQEENEDDTQYSTPYVKQYYNQFNSNLAVSNSAIDDNAYRNTLMNPNVQLSNNSNGDLINKMNHMIHLLEDQQSRKTEHVTEEIILYSFLGIFTIFVVDSFAKVGKYVR